MPGTTMRTWTFIIVKVQIRIAAKIKVNKIFKSIHKFVLKFRQNNFLFQSRTLYNFYGLWYNLLCKTI